MDRGCEKEKARKRRNHKFRMRVRAYRIMKYCWWWVSDTNMFLRMPMDEAEKNCQERAAIFADRMQSCSCSMCGNPRRHFKARTFSEKRKRFLIEAQLEEVEIHPSRARSVFRFVRDKKVTW